MLPGHLILAPPNRDLFPGTLDGYKEYGRAFEVYLALRESLRARHAAKRDASVQSNRDKAAHAAASAAAQRAKCPEKAPSPELAARRRAKNRRKKQERRKKLAIKEAGTAVKLARATLEVTSANKKIAANTSRVEEVEIEDSDDESLSRKEKVIVENGLGWTVVSRRKATTKKERNAFLEKKALRSKAKVQSEALTKPLNYAAKALLSRVVKEAYAGGDGQKLVLGYLSDASRVGVNISVLTNAVELGEAARKKKDDVEDVVRNLFGPRPEVRLPTRQGIVMPPRGSL